MELFDKISDAIVSAGQDAGKKAKEISGVAKLRYDSKAKEIAVRDKYRELGKKYYEAHKDDENAEEAELIAEIREALEEIEGIKSEILDAQGAAVCPHCGAKIKPEDSYCSSCGARVDDIFEDEDVDVVDENEA